MVGPEIERLIALLARLPGLGPRSARRAALALVERKDSLLDPLARALAQVAHTVKTCPICGNFDSCEPCAICADPTRDESQLCVVADVGSLWAMERTGAFKGRYHVLGGLLSALDGVGPDDLAIESLRARAASGRFAEIILALPATVEAQTTAHFVQDRLAASGARLSALAQGVPVGGELDYLDDGTLSAALKARRTLS
ncbi:gap repair protein [Magnetospirillum sp. LM-5]|uniref:recombination mediator RecR n=1 Tax=Magnetospirillum sp. LM-5 TaxID=2681466 RepID=UPI0013830E8F|nr:recombination mediator RecR [Magnetospirillum sp. LM-5]CAA7625471.1 gap repair protein [Magnetospirillum sp. LM-5]